MYSRVLLNPSENLSFGLNILIRTESDYVPSSCLKFLSNNLPSAAVYRRNVYFKYIIARETELIQNTI